MNESLREQVFDGLRNISWERRRVGCWGGEGQEKVGESTDCVSVGWRKLWRYGALEGVNRKGGGCQMPTVETLEMALWVGTGVGLTM